MALKEYEGAIVLEVDGTEVEIESFEVTHKSGRKPVKTMNRTGRATGFAKGISEITLKLSAVVPITGDIDWINLQGAKLTSYPLGGGLRTSYLDCFTVELGKKYKVDGEAIQDLQMIALRKVQE